MMQNLNCIIIDDDKFFLKLLTRYCERSNILNVAGSFDNALDGMKFLKSRSDIDLIFLDIHMPVISGIDLIDSLDRECMFILTTADETYVLQAYQYPYVIDYLLKPISEERFALSMDKVKRIHKLDINTTETDNSFFVNVNKRLIKINPDDVLYIQANGDYIDLFLKKERYLIHSTVKRILEKLPEDVFIRVHHSYIINSREIIDIQDNTILLAKKVIPIGRSYRKAFYDRIQKL